MQYLALLVAFLCETTAYPAFIKTSLHIESITIAYFVIILATQKKMPVVIPAMLLLTANILTGGVVGLGSILLFIGAFFHNRFFVTRDRAKFAVAKPNQSSAITMFAVIFAVMIFIKMAILAIFGYSISFPIEIFSYIINFAIFVIFAICLL